jgi:hypothetical protein
MTLTQKIRDGSLRYPMNGIRQFRPGFHAMSCGLLGEEFTASLRA